MKLILAFAFVAVLVAVMAPRGTSASSPPKNWHANPPGKWGKERENSPTDRRTIHDGVGQEIHHTVDEHGHVTRGFLAKKGTNTGSPKRQGQPSTGGPASTSQKSKGKGKEKGH